MRWTTCGLWLLLLVPWGPARGDWTDVPGLPDWSQRSQLCWGMTYNTSLDERILSVLQGLGVNLIHGGTLASPAAGQWALGHGLSYMSYVDIRTFRLSQITASPGLSKAAIYGRDGREIEAYNNPERRLGSLASPEWLQHILKQMQSAVADPAVGAVFFDNAFWAGLDYRPENVRDFQEWAARQAVPANLDSPAGRIYMADQLVAFHRVLQQSLHAHQPPLLTSPNLSRSSPGGLYAAESGVIDIVLNQTATHPPFVNNTFLYKQGLAASHGRPTGLVASLPPAVAARRGEQVWEPNMHAYFSLASPVPEELELAMAEGAATGGTCATAYNMYPSLPLLDPRDPFVARTHRALRRINRFLKVANSIYQAEPAAQIAVLYSPENGILQPQYTSPSAAAQSLIEIGLPFEVVVPSDLPDRMPPEVRELVAPDLRYLDQETADGLLRWADAGGNVLFTGELADADTLGRPPGAAAQKLVRALQLHRLPWRSWTLQGAAKLIADGPLQVTDGPGGASCQPDLPAGSYQIHMGGVLRGDFAEITVRSEGREIWHQRLVSAESNLQQRISSPISLPRSAQIQLEVTLAANAQLQLFPLGFQGAGMIGRIPVGTGSLRYRASGLAHLKPEERAGLLNTVVRLAQPGRICTNMMKVAATKLTTIHLVNYDFKYSYPELPPGTEDDGGAEQQAYLNNTGIRIRKTLRLTDLPVEAELRLSVQASQQATGKLIVHLNGREICAIAPAGARIAHWIGVPIASRLLQANNLVEIFAEGDLDPRYKWWRIGVDEDTDHQLSSLSTDGGRTFQPGRLSADDMPLRGEYMIRIVATTSAGSLQPGNLIVNPSVEVTRAPFATPVVTITPTDCDVIVNNGRAQPALVVSPDAPPQWVEGETVGNVTHYRVPALRIYSVLVLAPTTAALEPLRQALLDAHPWTEVDGTGDPLPRVDAWDTIADGFVSDTSRSRSGQRSLRIDETDTNRAHGASQQITLDQQATGPIEVEAWSMAQNVSGPADTLYAMQVTPIGLDGAKLKPIWVPFEVGTHDWTRAKATVDVGVPLKAIGVFLQFHHHSGTVWFDDIAARKVSRGGP